MPRTAGVSTLYDDPEVVLKPHEAWRVTWDGYQRSKRQLVDQMRDKWKEWARAYKCYVEVDDDDILSAFAHPAIFGQVESFVPRAAQAPPPRGVFW